MGQAIVERLRREGVTLDELPRIAAVIGADGGRLLWPWPRPPRDDRPPRKARLPDGGVGCTALGEAVAAARDAGVEASAAALLRPPSCPRGRPAGPPTRPHGYPADFARDAAAIEATKIQELSSAAPPSRPSAWLRRRCPF